MRAMGGKEVVQYWRGSSALRGGVKMDWYSWIWEVITSSIARSPFSIVGRKWSSKATE